MCVLNNCCDYVLYAFIALWIKQKSRFLLMPVAAPGMTSDTVSHGDGSGIRLRTLSPVEVTEEHYRRLLRQHWNRRLHQPVSLSLCCTCDVSPHCCSPHSYFPSLLFLLADISLCCRCFLLVFLLLFLFSCAYLIGHSLHCCFSLLIVLHYSQFILRLFYPLPLLLSYHRRLKMTARSPRTACGGRTSWSQFMHGCS